MKQVEMNTFKEITLHQIWMKLDYFQMLSGQR